LFTKIIIKISIALFKKHVAFLEKKTAETRSNYDDLALQALKDVISLYEIGELDGLFSSR